MRAFVQTAVAVVVSSLLQTMIFPVAGPLPVWRALLAWVALVPWFCVLLRLPVTTWREVRTVALWSYVCGILWYFGHCYWIYDTMHLYGGLSTGMAALALFLFCCYLGLYHLVFGLVVAVVRWVVPARSRWFVLVLPVVWVAVELARARVTSFPWDLLGYAQVDHAVLTRMAPWAGVYAISFVLALANAGFAWAWVDGLRGKGVGLATVYAVVALAVLGLIVHAATPGFRDVAVLVQPDLSVAKGPVQDGVSLERELAGLSVRAVASAGGMTPRVVLWPESPAPFETTQPVLRADLTQLAKAVGAPVIAGAVGLDERPGLRRPRVFNSAMLVTPGTGYAGRYDKIHLVPFGEFVPYASLFSFASGLTQAVGLFDRGTSRVPLVAEGHRYGVFVCYESIFGDEVRQLVRAGADVLVNLSDDGWYGDTSAPFQHINMARMRAMENRRWVLRDTNTGITAAIDPFGTVRSTMPRHVLSALVAGFSYRTELTFYTRYGDWFAYLCALVAVGLVLAGVGKRFA